jgi:hypothetical protein
MRARRRRPKAQLLDFPPIEDELDYGIRRDLYVWTVSKYLLPADDSGPRDVRARRIQTAREHEAAMWRKYPDGPGSLPGVVKRLAPRCLATPRLFSARKIRGQSEI